MILEGDSIDILKTLQDDSVDFVCTDPPYGYSFMGKDWDRAVPNVEIWQECLRVLKPGAFMCVMSAPRSDVQNAMISRLMEAGFRLDFTPIYWTYSSGFPKAGDVAKLIDKRLGVESEIIGYSKAGKSAMGQNSGWNDHNNTTTPAITKPTSDLAKQFEGAKTGFQPKPAVEVIIVAMKPLSEKTYVDQALKNGKGITWLDDCRVPTNESIETGRNGRGDKATFQASELNDKPQEYQSQGRFPANLLVSDDVLNDGVVSKSAGGHKNRAKKMIYGGNSYNESVTSGDETYYTGDSGSYSRYFDLDKWASTLPFLIVPKASKSEKNKGLEHLEDKQGTNPANQRCTICSYVRVQNQPGRNSCTCPEPNFERSFATTKNHHPTVKPLKLMSYLITLFSREGDTVLDPFVGSGTTILAAKNLKRKGIGIEREPEYAEIARARLDSLKQESLL